MKNIVNEVAERIINANLTAIKGLYAQVWLDTETGETWVTTFCTEEETYKDRSNYIKIYEIHPYRLSDMYGADKSFKYQSKKDFLNWYLYSNENGLCAYSIAEDIIAEYGL